MKYRANNFPNKLLFIVARSLSLAKTHAHNFRPPKRGGGVDGEVLVEN
jgi:hypothetical protein